MYRVLIVDDEPFIRSGISAFIDWEKEGMTVEDHFENGLEALEAIQKNPFDILITDIKMPLMDGIQLMKEALSANPSLKVILISSFDDFEYVREGLKLGAVDYLLKPTLEPEALTEVIRRCVGMLEVERRKGSELVQYRQKAIYRDRRILEQEIKKLIVQEKHVLSPRVGTPSWMENSYTCINLLLDRADEIKENNGYLYIQLILEEFQEIFYAEFEEGVALLTSEYSMFFLFPSQAGKLENRFCEIKKIFEEKWGISTSAGSVCGKGKYGIYQGYSQSRLVYQKRFFEGLGGYFKINAWEYKIQARERFHDWASFFEPIRNGEPIQYAIEIAVEHWKRETLSQEQIKDEASNLFIQSFSYLMQVDTKFALPEQLEMLRRTETLQQLSSILSDLLEEIRDPYFPKMVDNENGGQTIKRALEYITAHYTENVSLQCVAEIVHLSKNYFSFLFKKQTGLTFIDYLIELRIREAKRLLIQEDKRIYEVSSLSGFKDVKYFGKMFKKVTGLTPLEYREKYRRGETN